MAIEFDFNVPSANACDCRVEEMGGTTVATFSADPRGGPESLWFRFGMVNRSAGAEQYPRVNLILRNAPTLLGGGAIAGGGRARVRPVIRFEGKGWERLEDGRPVRHADGRVDVEWSFTFRGKSADVAACYPYGPADLEATLSLTRHRWHVNTIGVSQGGRAVRRLSNRPGREGGTQAGVYLVARQHAGETPGSWVLDGLLRELALLDDEAPLTWCVPLADIDGVEEGAYGKDRYPYDLNRAWGVPVMRHEALVIKQDLVSWRARCAPRLVLDLHAPGLCETEGFYAMVPPPERDPGRHAALEPLLGILADAIGPLYVKSGQPALNTYPTRWATSTLSACAWEEFRAPGITLECPYALAGETLLTQVQYQETGRRIAHALAERLPP